MLSRKGPPFSAHLYRVVQKNVPCLKIPTPIAATQWGLPWTAQSAIFGKFYLNSLNLAPFLLLNPVDLLMHSWKHERTQERGRTDCNFFPPSSHWFIILNTFSYTWTQLQSLAQDGEAHIIIPSSTLGLGMIQKICIGEQIAIQARVRREHEPPCYDTVSGRPSRI